ncbi:MAG: shikimate kinase [Clostridia bacterium]
MTMAEMTDAALALVRARAGCRLIAIDGMCGSGKSTLGQRLAEALGGNLLHMDDFFLTAAQRTPERLAQVGGNVDYERFERTVLRPLLAGVAFSYRPFDCAKGALAAAVQVAPRPVTVVEGAYSLHPYFADPWDVRLFVETPPDVQQARILARNGAKMLDRFVREWIPMENQYFSQYALRKHCDRVLTSGGMEEARGTGRREG